MPKPKKPRRRKDTLLYMSALQMMEGLSLVEDMSRAQLRDFMALFVVGSALTVAVFFLALWLLPEQPFIPFSFPRFPGFF